MPSSFLFGLFFWREGVEPLPYEFYRASGRSGTLPFKGKA